MKQFFIIIALGVVLLFSFSAPTQAATCVGGDFLCFSIGTEDTNSVGSGGGFTISNTNDIYARNFNDGEIGSNSLFRYIIDIGYFINNVLLPLLFGIALLYFLYNMFVFYINSANVSKREDAQRAAIYGIAAFVFLVSIWGIVNLLVIGFGFDEETAICPDYLGSFCDGPVDSGIAISDGNIDLPCLGGYLPEDDEPGFGDNRVPCVDDTPALVDFGCGSGESGCSPLANLLFGDFKDEARLSFSAGPARARTNTVAVSPLTSCEAGLNTLQQAANVESNQAAYLYYTDSAGISRWENVTDTTSATSIGYDADTINNLSAAGATGMLLVHTHPRTRTEAADLAMNGHGPSAADHLLLCDRLVRNIPLVTVDHQNFWLSRFSGTPECPFTAADENDIEVIDALFAASVIILGDRADEFAQMTQADLTPNRLANRLNAFNSENLGGINRNEVRALVTDELDSLGLDSRIASANFICNNARSAVTTPPPQPPIAPLNNPDPDPN